MNKSRFHQILMLVSSLYTSQTWVRLLKTGCFDATRGEKALVAWADCKTSVGMGGTRCFGPSESVFSCGQVCCDREQIGCTWLWWLWWLALVALVACWLYLILVHRCLRGWCPLHRHAAYVGRKSICRWNKRRHACMHLQPVMRDSKKWWSYSYSCERRQTYGSEGILLWVWHAPSLRRAVLISAGVTRA